jgi:hypothetical protein
VAWHHMYTLFCRAKSCAKYKSASFSFFFNRVFWAFLGEGSLITPPDPGPFLAPDPTTHHGGHRLFFWPATCHHRAFGCAFANSPRAQGVFTPAHWTIFAIFDTYVHLLAAGRC